MRINNNIIAQNSHRQYGLNTASISTNTERLSSGMRINRAADDAAGLAISEKMRTQIRGLNRASMNILDGVSLLQVGDGALQGVHDKMQRLRELAVQAANDTNDDLDRAAIQLEFGQLTSEINSTVRQTNFNGRVLFDGSIGASWEYTMGRITIPYDTTITATGDFAGTPAAPVTIPGWTAANIGIQSIGTHHFPPDGDFPDTGLFAIQIVTPADGTLNVIMDLSVSNPDGTMTRDEFFRFFIDGFNNMGLGHIVDGMRVDLVDGDIILDFPREVINGVSTLTGVMGRPNDDPVALLTRPRVAIGIGGIPQQLNSLNEIHTNSPPFFAPGPFITYTNRPSPNIPIPAPDPFHSATETIIGAWGGMHAGSSTATPPSGGFHSVAFDVTLDGETRSTTVNLVPGIYPDVESFVDANREAFQTAHPRSFDIDIDQYGMIIFSTRSNVDSASPDISMTVTFTPPELEAALGFGGSPDSVTERVPGGSLWIQSGANEGDGIHIEIPRLCTRSLGISIRRPEDQAPPEDGGPIHINPLGPEGYVTTPNVEPSGPPPAPWEYSLSVLTHETASASLSVLTNAINIISTERARIGAQQNRLEHARNNVDNSAENLGAAESRIRDTDMALEMSVFVRNQILMQSGTAMLAQANALPQGVLQMLG